MATPLPPPPPRPSPPLPALAYQNTRFRGVEGGAQSAREERRKINVPSLWHSALCPTKLPCTAGNSPGPVTA